MKSLLACLVVGLGAATLFAEELTPAQKADLDALEGQWSMTSGAVNGAAMSDEMARQFKRTCEGDVVRVSNGMQLVMWAKITLDPTKTPKTIDYEILEGATKGKKHLGIYEISGDTLKSCFGAPDTERPTDFSTKEGDRRVYSLWKRETK